MITPLLMEQATRKKAIVMGKTSVSASLLLLCTKPILLLTICRDHSPDNSPKGELCSAVAAKATVLCHLHASDEMNCMPQKLMLQLIH